MSFLRLAAAAAIAISVPMSTTMPTRPEPSVLRLDPALDKVEDLSNRALFVIDHRSRFASRDELSRIGIRAVGKFIFEVEFHGQ